VHLIRFYKYLGSSFSIQFGFYKKKITKLKLKKNLTETGYGLVWFGFLGQKLVQTGLTRFFSV